MMWWTLMVALAADPAARAWNAYELKLWDVAREEADKALQGKLDKKERSQLLLVLATARQQLGEDGAALQSAQECVALGSRDAEACTAIVAPLALSEGMIAFNAGVGGDGAATARAVSLLEAHVAAVPDSAEGQLMLGRALLLADRPTDAVAPLKVAVGLDASPAAVGRLVQAHAEAGQLDEAIAAAGAHPMGPESIRGLLALGQALQPDRPDDAIAQYRAAVAADPASAPAHKLLGVALVNSTGRAADADAAQAALDEGRKELEAALAAGDKSALGPLAQVARALGDDEAAAAYEAQAK